MEFSIAEITIATTAFWLGFCKSIADSYQHKDVWVKTWFSIWFDENGYFGPANKSWTRKYKVGDNVLVAYLRKTVFVPFSDFWHLVELFRFGGAAGGLLTLYYQSGTLNWNWILGALWGIRIATFYLFYMYVWRWNLKS